MDPQSRSIGILAVVVAWFALVAFTWPWDLTGPWPGSSNQPVVPLERPMAEASIPPDATGVRFAVFGDQRALADGEWQALIAAIDRSRMETPIDFLVDTGDIVQDGRHSDQFPFLRAILEPVSDLPYLVSVGNHETRDNRDPVARLQTATFLTQIDPAFSAERFYFRKDLGPCRVLFLDSNDFVYGDDGDERARTGPLPGSRAAAQMHWLTTQLSHREPPGTYTIVVLHHPFLQSSAEHREQAVALWDYGSGGRKLRDLFVSGGVDLVLTGHTHTYERFLLEKDGARMHLLNISGRPRTSFLWIGDGARRPEDVRGREPAWFARHGWNLDGWKVEQRALMLGDERDQFAVFEIEGAEAPTVSVYLLDEGEPSGVRLFESVVLE